MPFSPNTILAVLVGVLVPQVALASLVINELFPDPAGSDQGREFVELFNSGPETVSLYEVMLQFANGAEGAIWSTRWTGSSGDQLAPGDRFLIVDRNWLGDPAGQAEVALGLQNGPDALRLARGETVLDLVGYGPLTDPDLKEGDPADIATGQSLARRPDGSDTDNNRTDFVLAEPTPGVPNFHSFSLRATSWHLEPPSVDRPAVPVEFTVEILNDGIEAFHTGPLLLRYGGGDHFSLLDELPAGQTRRISWILIPNSPGQRPLELKVPLPGDRDTLTLFPASLQVGPGVLILNEVLAGPRQGQGEWVEIAVADQQGVDLKSFSLRDEDGSWRTLPDLWLEPGGFLVLTQDSLALANWHLDNHTHGGVSGCVSDLAISRQRNLPGWPSLNNSPPAGRHFADRVYLADSGGTVIDHLTLPGMNGQQDGTVAENHSLERLAPIPRTPGASNWAPCTAWTGSTPGCGNSVAATADISAGLTVRPRVLDPTAGVTSVHFLFTLTGTQIGWELRVFDLEGSLVRDLGGESLGPGPRDLMWDGRDDRGRSAGPGGYVVMLEIRDSGFQSLLREKVLMVIR